MAILQLNNDTLPLLTQQLEATQVIGVDTEFHAERRFLPLLLLIQLQIPNGDTWIIDATKPERFIGLKHSVLDKVWVVHGGRYDLVLLHDLLGALPQTIWDTQIIAGTLELYYPSPYSRLLQVFLDVSVPKHSTLSNWARRPLTDEQIQYAAEDVLHLIPLWEKILQLTQDTGRFELARTLCERQRQGVLAPEPADTLYRHHHVLQHLSAQEAAVFQELIAWRHTTGQTNNQPPRSVLNDGLVIELSRRQPTNREALRQDRRMPKRVIAMHGDTLIDLIQRAAQRPEWGWPKRIAAYSLSWVQRQRVDGFLAQDGYLNHYSPRLVFPSDVLDTLIIEGASTESQWAKKLTLWFGILQDINCGIFSTMRFKIRSEFVNNIEFYNLNLLFSL